MKKITFIFTFLLLCLSTFAQMPTDGNYSYWDWENQSQDNWKTKYGNIWTDIRPPFAASTPRLGIMSSINYSQDYTKAKGWKLVWAQFNGPYPWFALYNPHKSIIRVFFYLEDIPFTEVLATLTYQDVNNPCLLSFGKQYQSSNLDYYNNSANSENDMIAVVIRKLGAKSWGAADFPILYDKFITDSKYNNKKWEFTFYGCDNYAITLAGKESTDPDKTDPAQDDQHTIVTNKSAVTLTSLKADQAKLQKEISSIEGFIKSMKESASKVDTTIGFMNNYKKTVNSVTVKNISSLLSFASSLNSSFGAILGFANIISGLFDESTSTPAVAVVQYLNLTGTMTLKSVLGGNTLSIPGLSSEYYPATQWNPYNCPMGIISLEKTPKIKVTTSYEKYGSSSPVYHLTKNNKEYFQAGTSSFAPEYPILGVSGVHPLISGYPGKVKKYKFEDDIIIAQQKISGLSLVDLNFAIICKTNGTGNRKYSIKNRFIASHTFYDLYGSSFSVPFENPVYKALEDERFIIHKYDEDNDEIYFGTPYMSKNKLKGVVFEVPEDTEVKLAIYAKYNSDKYSEPIIFKAIYNIVEVPEQAQLSRVIFNDEQTNFNYSDYYNSRFYIGLTSPYNIQVTACTIEMLPGFTGNDGFTANSLPFFKNIEIGNTIINETDFNCTSIQHRISMNSVQANKKETSENQKILKPTLYPNPTNGIIKIINPTEETIIGTKIYTSSGQVILTINPSELSSGEFDISSLQAGIYFVNLQTESKLYTVPIILKK